MASVAICPHCYLQLMVPDGVEPDERVECPTCAKEFGLDDAVLRAIPEVVRRSRAADLSAADASSDVVNVEEVVEIEELAAARDRPLEDGSREAEFVKQIKSRIEDELAAGTLLPGMSASLSLETPESLDELASLPEPESEPLDEWHRPTVRLSELTQLEDEIAEDGKDTHDAAVEDSVEPSFDDAEDSLDIADQSRSVNDSPANDDVNEAAAVPDDSETNAQDSEVVEPPARPAATTLADLMPPVEDHAPQYEADDEVLGPSFELPNVPLTPPSSATAEFDPATTFGPAAETEFSLDHVDFEATEESVDEVVPTAASDEAATSEEMTEDAEPVFREPVANPLPDRPFVLPGVPRRRKKRSVIRLLVGTTLGGLFGLTVGYGVLLYLLGPEGDIFQVARYIPSSILPESFGNTAPPIVAQSLPPEPDASANVPATFTEEITSPETIPPTDELSAENAEEIDADEPSPLEEPAAEPIAGAAIESAPAPLPLSGPTYTVDQLAGALESAEAAQAGLVTGDLSDAAVRRTKGMSYARLCDLAQALTFADRSAPSLESEQAIDGAVRLFRETLSDSHTRSEVDRIATIWIDSPHRQHGGVFLAGAVSGGEIAGDVYQYELTTDDGNKLALLAAEPLDPLVEGSQHPVGIVGSIVANPADEVAGYRGTAERAIWVTRAIPLQ